MFKGSRYLFQPIIFGALQPLVFGSWFFRFGGAIPKGKGGNWEPLRVLLGNLREFWQIHRENDRINPHLGHLTNHKNIHWGCILRGIWISENAATRSHSSGRKWPQVAALPEWPQVAASGREWPPLPHNVMNSKLRKTPTRSRRQPTYPSQLEKKHLSNKTYFFKMFEDYRQKA